MRHNATQPSAREMLDASRKVEEIQVRVIGFANGAYVLRARIKGGPVEIHHRASNRFETALLERGLRDAKPVILEVGGTPAARVRP